MQNLAFGKVKAFTLCQYQKKLFGMQWIRLLTPKESRESHLIPNPYLINSSMGTLTEPLMSGWMELLLKFSGSLRLILQKISIGRFLMALLMQFELKT